MLLLLLRFFSLRGLFMLLGSFLSSGFRDGYEFFLNLLGERVISLPISNVLAYFWADVIDHEDCDQHRESLADIDGIWNHLMNLVIKLDVIL